MLRCKHGELRNTLMPIMLRGAAHRARKAHTSPEAEENRMPSGAHAEQLASWALRLALDDVALWCGSARLCPLSQVSRTLWLGTQRRLAPHRAFRVLVRRSPALLQPHSVGALATACSLAGLMTYELVCFHVCLRMVAPAIRGWEEEDTDSGDTAEPLP